MAETEAHFPVDIDHFTPMNVKRCLINTLKPLNKVTFREVSFGVTLFGVMLHSKQKRIEHLRVSVDLIFGVDRFLSKRHEEINSFTGMIFRSVIQNTDSKIKALNYYGQEGDSIKKTRGIMQINSYEN